MGRPVTKRIRAEEVMHLAVVACGNRLDETLTLVKSALLFSIKKIKFHIFAEDPLAPQFEERVRCLYVNVVFYRKRNLGLKKKIYCLFLFIFFTVLYFK